MIPLYVLTNGRLDCLTQTLEAIKTHLHGAGPLTIVDDSGNRRYRSHLRRITPNVIEVDTEPAGYVAAMHTVWRHAAAHEHIAFFEDDFLLTRDLDLNDLVQLLEDHPNLAQVALLRQPWFANEIEHGGLIEALEAQGQTFRQINEPGRTWIEHRAGFTGNPSVIPARTYRQPWPTGSWSEATFSRHLLRDLDLRFAYWGPRPRPGNELVHHIGTERVGFGY